MGKFSGFLPKAATTLERPWGRDASGPGAARTECAPYQLVTDCAAGDAEIQRLSAESRHDFRAALPSGLFHRAAGDAELVAEF